MRLKAHILLGRHHLLHYTGGKNRQHTLLKERRRSNKKRQKLFYLSFYFSKNVHEARDKGYLEARLKKSCSVAKLARYFIQISTTIFRLIIFALINLSLKKATITVRKQYFLSDYKNSLKGQNLRTEKEFACWSMNSRFKRDFLLKGPKLYRVITVHVLNATLLQ